MAALFSKPKKEEATRMPDPNDPAIFAERRRQVAEQRQRGGRDSTIMSESLIGATGKLGA